MKTFPASARLRRIEESEIPIFLLPGYKRQTFPPNLEESAMRRSFRKVPIRSLQVAGDAHLEIWKIADGIQRERKRQGPLTLPFVRKSKCVIS